MNQYHEQADAFLAKHAINFRATLSDSKEPQWSDDGAHGHHYRVTLSRAGWRPDRRKLWEKLADNDTLQHNCDKPSRNRLVFDFWGSVSDAKKLKKAETDLVNARTPSPIFGSIFGACLLSGRRLFRIVTCTPTTCSRA